MRDTKNHNKEIAANSLIAVLLAFYFLYSIGLFLRIPVNSDYSNLVLEASDILSGNIFLKDWNLTGITFLTTDLLYFVIGTALAGTTIKAYYIAVILMYFTLVTGGFLLLKTSGKYISLTDIIIFLAVGGLPGIYACDILRAHTPVPAFIFLALFFGIKSFHAKDRTEGLSRGFFLVFFTLFLTLSCAGDPISLIIGIAPIVLVCLYNLTGSNIVNRKMNIIYLSLSIISAISGKIIETLFFMADGKNKNSFLEDKAFGSIDRITENFKIYLNSILGMSEASFLGKKLFAISTLWYFLRIIVIIFSFYIMFKAVFRFIKRRNTDIVSVVLSLGFLLMSLVFILTDIITDIESARYIAYFPILCAVLIVRYLKHNEILNEKIFNRTLTKRLPVLVYAVLLMISSIQTVDYKIPVTPQDRLAAFLVQNGLQNGYAKFWNASHVTLASEGKVNVRAVIYDNDKHLLKFSWFCKNIWYTPEFSNFVVIENSDDGTDSFKITKEFVKKSLGKPAKVLPFENYSVYVYNVDITDRILK